LDIVGSSSHLKQVLVDTLLDDPNQRSSGGVTMLMNAANSGQRRMGTHTLEHTPKRNPLICKANNVLLRLKMPKGSLSAYWGIALSLIRHTIRMVQSYVHTWFNGGTGTGMDLKAKPFSCSYHKL